MLRQPVLSPPYRKHVSPAELPLRETFWNIPPLGIVGVYLGGLIAIALFVRGLAQRIALWRAGTPDARFDDLPQRFALLFKEGLLQTRVLARRFPGLMHVALFWGFLVLLAGTIVATVDWEITRLLFDWRLLQGPVYLVFEVTLDLFGAVFLVGIGMAAWRRLVRKPAHLTLDQRFTHMLLTLALIGLSGFLIEALRLAVTQPAWARWSSVGWLLAQPLLALQLPEAGLRTAHLAVWVAHALLVFVFIAIIPRTFFAHMIATPLNILLARLPPRARLHKIEDIETREHFGISRFEQFSWKRRLDFDACTECGRCQQACCAQISGSVLDPKAIIGKLRRYMHEGGGRSIEGKALHGDVIGADELWACTTCGACVAACPARIDIIDTIVDLRRHLALEQGAFPPAAAHTLHNIQRLGNPWGMDPADRLGWAAGLEVPLMEPDKHVEYLYWVGCSASFDQRNHHIARSMVKILRTAGISFGVMAEERCHAEVGRRLGEEYLFQTAAAENLANLQRYRFDKLLAHCPHCFNTLANEYPQFDGGRFSVEHHSRLIARLLQEGRLQPRLAGPERIAVHDACYLGRHNDEYAAPRAAVAAVGNAVPVEMARNRCEATCCGGGGGQMWMESHSRKRINIIRAEEAINSGAQTVAVSCPHCLTMLADARNAIGAQELRVRDIAEIVADALP
ncbi:MAG: 4Fe-4S dicluster domain-containing protein [Burkholderiaceae bacterium]|nr:4Fe-4S dicluster domain-containing protein [Burkholderiaceae bacterium]